MEAQPESQHVSWSAWDWIVLAIGTGLFTGMIPPRVATFSTLLGIPLAMGLSNALGWAAYVPILVVLWVIGIPICGRSAQLLAKKDPREVTYDEFVTLPLVYFLVPEFSLRIIIAGFTLHRIFDILKPFGIRRLERVGGGLGIMMDDIAASLIAFVVMRLLFVYQIL
ncbi:phosphatidylglycerophosphatase A [Kolteria novifilia]